MKSEVLILRGITWNHTRGYLPMVATAQRFLELNPGIEIRWEVRSLQEFADFSVENLARRYDLLVIDHPSCGAAATASTLLPLDEWIPQDFLADQSRNSVGLSHRSYNYEGHQWALAIDAATPVSGWRSDLLHQAVAGIPETWPQLLELARRGLVTIPAIPIDSLMHFYMLCGAAGEDPFRDNQKVVSEETGVAALQKLRELVALCDAQCLGHNPIATWELLASSNKVAYCPFAYGYSNYSRTGYASNVLETGGLVRNDNGVTFRSTLGGAGLAISSSCRERELAARYVQYVASPECQRGLFFESGGQPGYRAAWLDPEVNRVSHNFFSGTLSTLDAAFLRPGFHGYLQFQDAAGEAVHRYLTRGGSDKDVISELNSYLRATRTREEQIRC